MKKLLLVKIGVVFIFFSLFFFLVISIVSLLGYSIASETARRNVEDLRKDSYVINNNYFAEDYRKLLNQYMFEYGYVSLERIVWYLQETNNVLNINDLDFSKWQDAYIKNSNKELKQMIPTSEMCKQVNTTIYQPFNPPTLELPNPNINNDYYKIDLCNETYVKDKNAIYTTTYIDLPYAFPLKQDTMGSVTSMVNEKRNVNLDLSEEQLESVNFHSGWDFSASAETDIYSICDGIVTSISFTQNENIPFNDQPDPKNSSGNSISVKCDYTNDIVYYGHLYPNSASTKLKVNSKIKKGQFVAKVGTTGRSTGNHLHLGLQTATGVRLDALYFIDFSFNNYTN